MSTEKQNEAPSALSCGGLVRKAGDECCADWKPQCEHLNGPIILQSVRSGGRYQYGGKPFLFCPWCGERRPSNNVIGPNSNL